MSAYDTHRVLTRSGRPGFVTKLVAAILAWNDARVTRAALMKLSDRELDDIGISRGDIARVARG
ncbi:MULTISPECIES: DUF1127 domain-containing protein [Paracoccaceae]|uniref:DUF1127 domain-containing protein n=1 Tax=Paracoccaceae TaxID=31989 RepID=UPI00201FEA72|nr:DUF1127 domain-containing protein [Phaeovulum sp. NW3]MCL7463722.1 DUF1127 domain-containing protein [Phaeovulum sp. NW3]